MVRELFCVLQIWMRFFNLSKKQSKIKQEQCSIIKKPSLKAVSIYEPSCFELYKTDNVNKNCQWNRSAYNALMCNINSSLD